MAYDKQKNEQILDEFLSLESVDEKHIQKQMDIAAQIDNYLAEKGWSRKKLAEESGLYKSQITEILSGTANPTLRTITKLEEALGEDIIVSPDFFKQDMEEDGWINPNAKISLSAGSYRKEVFESEETIAASSETKSSYRVKRNQYSTASNYHLKRTGTYG